MGVNEDRGDNGKLTNVITLRHIPEAIAVFVIHNISYIYDSIMSKI